MESSMSERKRYFAILCNTTTGRKLRGYSHRAAGGARGAALKRADCISVIKHEEVSEADYKKIMDQSDQDKPFKSTVSVINNK